MVQKICRSPSIAPAFLEFAKKILKRRVRGEKSAEIAEERAHLTDFCSLGGRTSVALCGTPLRSLKIFSKPQAF